MKTTKTNREIVEFINTAATWLDPKLENETPDVEKKKERTDSKLGYALNKVQKKCQRLWERYQEDVEDVNVEHAAVDEKGIILRDDRNQYRYVKDDMKKRLKEIRALQDKKVDVEPHFTSDIPDDLTDDQKEIFTGFVIKPEAEMMKVVA